MERARQATTRSGSGTTCSTPTPAGKKSSAYFDKVQRELQIVRIMYAFASADASRPASSRMSQGWKPIHTPAFRHGEEAPPFLATRCFGLSLSGVTVSVRALDHAAVPPPASPVAWWPEPPVAPAPARSRVPRRVP